MWKKMGLVVLIAGILIFSVEPLLAQPPMGSVGKEKMRERIETLRLWKMIEFLDLSSEQSDEFLPLLHEFQKAQKENQSLFREIAVPPPFESVKDICAIRMNRIIDPYRKISIKNFQLRVNNATPRETVDLRIHPLSKRLCEVRIWCKNELIDVQKVKTNDLKLVHF